MKYTLKAILILILGCLTHSCLDLDPKDQIADGNYWNSVTDYKLFAIRGEKRSVSICGRSENE